MNMKTNFNGVHEKTFVGMILGMILGMSLGGRDIETQSNNVIEAQTTLSIINVVCCVGRVEIQIEI